MGRLNPFSTEEDKFFIHFYRDNEILWNPSHEQYTRREIRTAVLNVLRQKLEEKFSKVLSEDDVKAKFKCLRTSFNREERKVEKAERTGVHPYVPRWLHYKDLLFLRKSKDASGEANDIALSPLSQDCEAEEENFEHTTESKQPLQLILQLETLNEGTSTQVTSFPTLSTAATSFPTLSTLATYPTISTQATSFPIICASQATKIPATSTQVNTATVESTTGPSTSQITPARKRKEREDEVASTRVEKVSQKTVMQESDQVDYFCKFTAVSLRQLSDLNRVRAMHEMQGIVLKYMEMQNQTSE